LGYAIFAEDFPIEFDHKERNPKAAPSTNRSGANAGENAFTPMPKGAAASAPAESDITPEFDAPRAEFRVQFCWQERRLSERLQERAEAAMAENARRAEAAERAALETAADSGDAPPVDGAPVGGAPAGGAPAGGAPVDGAPIAPPVEPPAEDAGAAPAPVAAPATPATEG
jgi:hypothetical protein